MWYGKMKGRKTTSIVTPAMSTTLRIKNIKRFDKKKTNPL